MLYFIQGIHILLFGGEVFQEDCQAWAHGPVYKEVYEIFRDFQYNPIEDRRLTKFGNRVNELSEQESLQSQRRNLFSNLKKIRKHEQHLIRQGK